MTCKLTLTLGLFSLAATLCGQGLRDAAAVEQARRAIQEHRQNIVDTTIDLTDKEKQPFWNLYMDWRAKSAGIGDRIVALITKIDDSGTITDAEAKRMLDDWMKLQKEELKLRDEYIKRFRKIIPDRKVARFFQLEGKLDAIIDYDLASRVPLLE